MSLGLFTVDDQNHLWFDMDCHGTLPEPVYPKHFIYNVEYGTSDRILLLYTGTWMDQVNDAAKELLEKATRLSPNEVNDAVHSAMVKMTQPAAYARVIYCDASIWKVSRHARTDSGPEQEAPDTLEKTDLYYVGVGGQLAKQRWDASSSATTASRLREALSHAAANEPTILIPERRRPARIDRCTKPWAYPKDLLTE